MRRHQPGWQNNWELTSPEANISPYRAAVLIPSAAGSGSIFTTRSNKSFCSLEQKAGSGSPLWEVLQEKYLEICFLLLLFIFACLFFFLSFFLILATSSQAGMSALRFAGASTPGACREAAI